MAGPQINPSAPLQCQESRRSSEGSSAYICPWIKSEHREGAGKPAGLAGRGSRERGEGSKSTWLPSFLEESFWEVRGDLSAGIWRLQAEPGSHPALGGAALALLPSLEKSGNDLTLL